VIAETVCNVSWKLGCRVVEEEVVDFAAGHVFSMPREERSYRRAAQCCSPVRRGLPAIVLAGHRTALARMGRRTRRAPSRWCCDSYRRSARTSGQTVKCSSTAAARDGSHVVGDVVVEKVDQFTAG
jgi:hypothetical protein